jgi:hypothetical protein
MGFQLQYDFFIEIINIAFALTILISCKIMFKLEDIKFFILLGHFIFIFFANYVLFDPSYLGDQFTYLYQTMSMKGSSHLLPEFDSLTIISASFIFSIFPLPVINSVYSLSIINFIIIIFIYFFLRQKKVFTRSSEYFLLFFPSLLIYSSTATRDIIILFCMILFVYYVMIERKPILALIFFSPLIPLKLQNAILLLLLWFIYLILDYKHMRTYTIIIGLGIIAGIVLFAGKYFTLEKINMMRYGFYFIENPDKISEYVVLNSWSQLGSVTFFSFFRYIFEPYLWQAKGPLQFFQSVENVVVVILIVYYALKYRKFGFSKERAALLLFFVVSMAVYGLIIINAGTAARYRFTFVVLLIVFHNFFGEREKQLKEYNFIKKINTITA